MIIKRWSKLKVKNGKWLKKRFLPLSLIILSEFSARIAFLSLRRAIGHQFSKRFTSVGKTENLAV